MASSISSEYEYFFSLYCQYILISANRTNNNKFLHFCICDQKVSVPNIYDYIKIIIAHIFHRICIILFLDFKNNVQII